jgi:diguanylate cyclase (GGDEF)-like protein
LVLPNTELDDGILLARYKIDTISMLNIPHPDSSVAKCVTISLGCTSIRPGPEDKISTFIDAADRALYYAKQSGRNCACYMDLNNHNIAIINA